eukprot:TRINITY_DN8050_c0_g1_i1.p1 TRINITY_DN8050_c0_g1~~TRINITY_DN8050_c0_g1_i1.p1  ORF type:complete len:833 (-),score=179.81 TRINITY_DN8050_c0_g1_i1:329-2782(-)
MAKSAYETLEETRVATEEALAKMLSIKKEAKKDAKARSELHELITQISVLFITLRQVNRVILQEEDRVKAETESAKGPLDHTTLQLHNLMYEKNHYLKAIKACKDFKSKYPDIELVSEEDFFKYAPDELKGDPSINEDPHKRMLHRLNFELYQRKELCKQRDELELQKKQLLETIANRKKFIASLPSHLKALKKASLPVQQHFGVLHTKRIKQHQLAELLPSPLYILYSQLWAHKGAFDEHIDIEVVGNLKDAQAFARQQANKSAGVANGIDEVKLDDETVDEEEDTRRRKRSKKIQTRDQSDASGIYQVHPLSVILHVFDDEVTNTTKPTKLVTLRFEYLLKMHIVTVGIDGSHKVVEENFLINLFPDDTGVELPHEIAKHSMDTYFSYDEKRSQRPFKWVQHLAGIDFLPETPMLFADVPGNESTKNGSVKTGLAMYRQQHRIVTILERIRARKKSQLALKEQLDSLAKLKFPNIRYKNVPWATYTPSCSLHSWFSVEGRRQSSASHAGGDDAEADTSLVLDGEGNSFKPELESATEDGELPSVTHPVAGTYGKSSMEFALENSCRLALISKFSLPSRGKPEQQKGWSCGSSTIGENLSEKLDEDTALVLQDEIDGIESSHSDMEKDSSLSSIYDNKAVKCWEDYAAKEYCLIFRRDFGPHRAAVDLEAKVKISMEYPLRPPKFSLHLLSGNLKPPLPILKPGILEASDENDGIPAFEWHNELRAIEAEVNLHILQNLPPLEENQILGHQIKFLAMLFDLYIEKDVSYPEHQKGILVTDVGLSDPISGHLLTRSIRGRDKRMMISWSNKVKNFRT